jgi:hypothetical protein
MLLEGRQIEGSETLLQSCVYYNTVTEQYKYDTNGLLINVSEYFILFFVSDKCSTLSLPYITEP